MARFWASRSWTVFDWIAELFERRPAAMYPLLFVAALDFTQHFRLVLKSTFYFVLTLLGGNE